MRATKWIVMTELFVAACMSGTADPQDDGDGRGSGSGSGTGSGSGSGSGSSGDGLDPLYPRKSGTRIKMRVLTTPDGAKSLYGWRDTMLNVDCNFMTAIDGVLRCLPSGPYRNGYFGDAACTVPAFTVAPYDDPAFQYALEYDLTSYPLKYRVLRKGALTTSWYFKSGATCVAQTIPAGYTAYLSAGDAPPSTFQSATLAVE
jgi:hypothetical protein